MTSRDLFWLFVLVVIGAFVYSGGLTAILGFATTVIGYVLLGVLAFIVLSMAVKMFTAAVSDLETSQPNSVFS